MSRELHIEVAGSGPPLVLLHGWAMHGGVFAPLVERLSAGYSLHLVDLPGHGHSRDSELPLALDPVLDALLPRLPRAPWLGWSMGGLFALAAALRTPEAVPGLVMVCASPRFVRGDDWPHGMSGEIFQAFEQGLRDDWRATLERFIALEAFGSDAARDELRTLRDALFARGEPPAGRLADGLALLQQADLRSRLPELRVPSLWLAGRRDRVVAPRAMQDAAALAPDATWMQIEHAGHAPFLTHADEVSARLREFMRGA